METLYTIDFAPLIEPVLVLAGTVISVLGGYAVRWLAARVGVERQLADQAIRDYLEPGIGTAIEYAKVQIEGDWTKIEVREALVATAASFAIRRFPDALRHFGLLDPEKLRDLIEARLGEHAA